MPGITAGSTIQYDHLTYEQQAMLDITSIYVIIVVCMVALIINFIIHE